MTLSRVACGIVSGSLGVAAGAAALALETRFLGGNASRTFWVVFFSVGGGVFWLIDWLGLVSAPYTPPPINLFGPDDVGDPPAKSVDFRPIDLDDL